MKKTNKKGFTIVELVIVIAVIAILAAVLIPTFAGLIEKANQSVDMQVVNQMNTVLQAEEIVDGKPATVVEAKEILAANGCDDFTPHDSRNVFYWIGAENRVALWQKDEPVTASVFAVVAYAAEEAETGKVIHPKELAEKYKNITTVSADWADLSVEYAAQIVEPTEGQSLEQALFNAIANLTINDTDVTTVVTLPKNSELTFTEQGFQKFYSATRDASGLGKKVTVDLNGSTITGDSNGNYMFHVFSKGSLTLTNGKLALSNGYACFTPAAGASVVLKNIEITDNGSYATFFPAQNASEIILENCKVTSSANFGLSTNGLSSDNIHVAVKNTIFESSGSHAIILNVRCNVVIENSTISGGISAIAMRAGHLEVKNSTLKSTETDADIWKWDDFTHYDEKYGPYRMWGEGNAIAGSVLTLGDHDNWLSSYKGSVDCQLTNVKFESACADIPNVLLAAEFGKDVVLTYDATTNVGEYKLYDYAHKYGNGTVSVNGTALTFTGEQPATGTTQFRDNEKYTIPGSEGTFTAWSSSSVTSLSAAEQTKLRDHIAGTGVNLTDAQWATAKFTIDEDANLVYQIQWTRNP